MSTLCTIASATHRILFKEVTRETNISLFIALGPLMPSQQVPLKHPCFLWLEFKRSRIASFSPLKKSIPKNQSTRYFSTISENVKAAESFFHILLVKNVKSGAHTISTVLDPKGDKEYRILTDSLRIMGEA